MKKTAVIILLAMMAMIVAPSVALVTSLMLHASDVAAADTGEEAAPLLLQAHRFLDRGALSYRRPCFRRDGRGCTSLKRGVNGRTVGGLSADQSGPLIDLPGFQQLVKANIQTENIASSTYRNNDRIRRLEPKVFPKLIG